MQPQFRSWCEEKKKMFYTEKDGWSLGLTNNLSEDKPVMQLVKKSRRGHRYFEDDIIVHKDRNEGKPIVIIKQDLQWQGNYAGSPFVFPLNEFEIHRSTVIGNIHENPELLKVAK